MMVSVATLSDIGCRNESMRTNRCAPLSPLCAYTRNDSQMTASSSCSGYATTSSDVETEEWQLPRVPHPSADALGRLFAPHDFDILESLGEGFFSMVHKVRVRSSGEVLVLKVAKSGLSRRSEHASISSEMAMLRSLKHPNVLALRGVCIERNKFGWDAHLLMDYCSGGSLSRLILDSVRPMSWSERASYASDIAKAMLYIHGNKVIHRDLTSMNVLLQRGGPTECGWDKAVVADFGLSCEFPKNGEVLPQVGTTYFMSPECLNEEYYDEKSDVFSFGIILCQLIARIDADPDSGLHRTSRFGLNYVLFTSYCPPDTPLELLELAFTCCLMNPRSRPDFSFIVCALSRMTISRPPSPDSLKRIQGGRIGRSRSDAAVRSQMRLRLSLRKPSMRSNVQPLQEGEVMPSPSPEISALEQLARGVADAERSRVTVVAGNPFLGHERFRRERKIVPHRDQNRRRSETKHELGTPIGPIRCGLRRCSSLPSDMDQNGSSDEEREQRESPGPGGIPMTFRDFDQTFIREVKAMKRFPSRRHTLTPTVHAQSLVDSESKDMCDSLTNESSPISMGVDSIDESVILDQPTSLSSSPASFTGDISTELRPIDVLNNNPWEDNNIKTNDAFPVDTVARMELSRGMCSPISYDVNRPHQQKCSIL